MSNFFSQTKIHTLSKIKYIYNIYTIQICITNFSTMLDKEQQQQKETEIGKCKLNEMRAVNMKWKK